MELLTLLYGVGYRSGHIQLLYTDAVKPRPDTIYQWPTDVGGVERVRVRFLHNRDGEGVTLLDGVMHWHLDVSHNRFRHWFWSRIFILHILNSPYGVRLHRCGLGAAALMHIPRQTTHKEKDDQEQEYSRPALDP